MTDMYSVFTKMAGIDLVVAIRQYAGRELKDEIEHKLSVQDDELITGEIQQFDLALAFEDASESFERWRNRKVINECNKIGVAVGMYREVSDEEYRNTQVMGRGGKDSEFFKLGGKRYVFDKHLEPYYVEEGFKL